MLYMREGYPEEDELVFATVTKIKDHAVFVHLEEYDKGGLIHISEIAAGRIRNISEYVDINKKIVCKVLRIDTEKGHIDLSLRRVSEIERKKKLDQIKQEQKAERIIENIAEQEEKEVKKVYNKITEDVFQDYPYLYQFFQEIATEEVKASEYIDDEKLAEKIQEYATQRFKPSKVTIKGEFEIETYAKNGLELIKNTIEEAKKKAEDTTTIEINYLGGGRYTTEVKAQEYKTAEKTLDSVKKHIIEKISENKGEAKFARAET